MLYVNYTSIYKKKKRKSPIYSNKKGKGNYGLWRSSVVNACETPLLPRGGAALQLVRWVRVKEGEDALRLPLQFQTCTKC